MKKGERSSTLSGFSLVPRSLTGRMILMLIMTLTLAQLVNFALLSHQRQSIMRDNIYENAASRFIDAVLDYQSGDRLLPEGPPLRLARRREALWKDDQSILGRTTLQAQSGLSRSLASGLQTQSVAIARVEAHYGRLTPMVRAGVRGIDSPRRRQRIRQIEQRIEEGRPRDLPFAVFIALQLDGSSEWINAIYRAKPPPPAIRWQDTVMQTAITGLFFMVVLGLFATQIRKPLSELSKASEAVGRISQPVRLDERGPQEIRDVKVAFNQMHRRVGDLLAEKDIMLGAIGHDLRTPLTALRLRLEQLGPDMPRQKAVEAVEEMATLLDDILDLARLQNMSVKSRSISLPSLLGEIAEGYRAMGAQLFIGAVPDISFEGNPDALRRMLRNIIDNAIAYGGSADLAAVWHGDQLSLEITDKGPGIPEERLADIMEPFERGERSRNKQSGGAGLGLAIARSVALAHGGSLNLENIRSIDDDSIQGLIATIRLPMAENQNREHPT